MKLGTIEHIAAYTEGYHACKKADGEVDGAMNPYPDMTKEFYSWNKGWNSYWDDKWFPLKGAAK